MRSHRINEDDYLAAQRLHMGVRSRRWNLTAWGVLTLALALVVAIVRSDRMMWLLFALLWAFLSLMVLVALPFTHRRDLTAIYREHKRLHETSNWRFDDEALEGTSESGHGRLRWADIHSFKENDDMFLIYEARNLYYILPKRAFESDQELQFFSQILQRGR